MSAQHTSGPWEFVAKLSGSENHRGYFIRAEKTSRHGKWALAEVQPGDADGELGAANARLIAAAPDLLAALKGVLRVADRATVEFDAARAAIAKATESQK
jgi:hypothetical protein